MNSLRYGPLRALRNLGVALLMATPAFAEPVTIVAFGDSLTAGYGLDTQDGFVPVMQNWLDGQGAEVTLINAGLSGDTTTGGLARLDWTLTEDVDAMIVALGGNDYLRGLDPAVTRDNLDQILATADARGIDVLLVGMRVGLNYGPDYKDAFDSIFTDLSATYDVPLYASWFTGLLAVAGMQEGVSEYMQADGLHPNAEGVRIIVEAMGPSVLALAESAD